MKIVEIDNIISNYKKNKIRGISNIIWTDYTPDEEVECVVLNEGLVFWKPDSVKQRACFWVDKEENLFKILEQIPSGKYIDIFHNNEKCQYDDIFFGNNLIEYAKYKRFTTVFKDNPYKYPPKGKREELLVEFYDPSMIQFARREDIPDLMDMLDEAFNPLVDDIFSLEEWEEIIDNQLCAMYRENGELLTAHVWKLEGQKFYNNVVVNKGPANLLYNMERFIFEKYWEEGIRVFYAWICVTNVKAIKRRNFVFVEEAIQKETFLYNTIYKKI